VDAKVTVVKAETRDAKRVAFRLRHQVLVEELGYEVPGADAEGGVMEPSDEAGAIFIAYDGEAPIGTLSVDWWKEVDIDPHLADALQLDAFAQAFGRESVFLYRKAAMLSRYRRTSAAWQLLMACNDFQFRKPSPQFLICDCAPRLIRYYQGLGLRCYAPHFSHGVNDLSVPMCAVMNDLDYLRQSQARLYPVAMNYGLPHLPEVRDFFAATWVQKAPHVVDPDDEAGDTIALEQIPLFKGMEAAAVRRFMQACEPYSLRAEQTVVAPDDPTNDLHLIRRGYVEVASKKAERRVVVATLAPGDVVGEMNMLLHTGRSAEVVALTDVDALRIPAEVLRGHYDAAALAQINLNLAEMLARRLHATTRPV
jgi:hypothetical protein